MMSILGNEEFEFSRYGGIYERGSREYTLDDFYSLSLDKLDRYVCLKECEVVIPVDGEESSSDEEEDEDEDEDRESESDDREDEDDHKGELEEDFAEDGGDAEQIVDEKARVLQFFHVLKLITASRPHYALRRMHSSVSQKTPLDLPRTCSAPLSPVKL